MFLLKVSYGCKTADGEKELRNKQKCPINKNLHADIYTRIWYIKAIDPHHWPQEDDEQE